MELLSTKHVFAAVMLGLWIELGIMVILVLIIVFLVYSRKKMIRLNDDMLAFEVENRTQELVNEVEERRRAEESALQASREKNNFLANMSHEIRTPLNGIIGSTELLAETKLDKEQKEYLNATQSSAATLMQMINGVLDFYQIESGKLKLEKVAFSLEDLLNEVVVTFSVILRDRDIVIDAEMDEALPNYMVGDPFRIRQVLNNLISNAEKFTDHGKILIKVIDVSEDNSPERVLQFSVFDTGIGIAEESLNEVFESFTQADSSTTRKYGGSGLGLTITKSLVELMGGEIWVESELGSGSAFHFTLQLIKPSRKSEWKQSTDEDEELLGNASFGGFNILLVEDNLINQKVAKRMLRMPGLIVEDAKDGKEAFDKMTGDRYDLILMDINMPEMDGYTVTRKFRALAPEESNTPIDVPIIAVTANALKGDKEKCLDAGMDDYMAKPFTKRELYAALGNWL